MKRTPLQFALVAAFLVSVAWGCGQSPAPPPPANSPTPTPPPAQTPPILPDDDDRPPIIVSNGSVEINSFFNYARYTRGEFRKMTDVKWEHYHMSVEPTAYLAVVLDGWKSSTDTVCGDPSAFIPADKVEVSYAKNVINTKKFIVTISNGRLVFDLDEAPRPNANKKHRLRIAAGQKAMKTVKIYSGNIVTNCTVEENEDDATIEFRQRATPFVAVAKK